VKENRLITKENRSATAILWSLQPTCSFSKIWNSASAYRFCHLLEEETDILSQDKRVPKTKPIKTKVKKCKVLRMIIPGQIKGLPSPMVKTYIKIHEKCKYATTIFKFQKPFSGSSWALSQSSFVSSVFWWLFFSEFVLGLM